MTKTKKEMKMNFLKIFLVNKLWKKIGGVNLCQKLKDRAILILLLVSSD